MGKLEVATNQHGCFKQDIKRFYVFGTEFKAPCPKCDNVATRNLGSNYLSYPTTNTPMELSIYCPECDESWVAGHIILKISVEVVEQ